MKSVDVQKCIKIQIKMFKSAVVITNYYTVGFTLPQYIKTVFTIYMKRQVDDSTLASTVWQVPVC